MDDALHEKIFDRYHIEYIEAVFKEAADGKRGRMGKIRAAAGMNTKRLLALAALGGIAGAVFYPPVAAVALAGVATLGWSEISLAEEARKKVLADIENGKLVTRYHEEMKAEQKAVEQKLKDLGTVNGATGSFNQTNKPTAYAPERPPSIRILPPEV